MVTASVAGQVPRQMAQALRDPGGEGLWQEGQAEGQWGGEEGA